MNVIGDVAGEYDTLLALVKKMPKDEIVLLGDIIDRGKKSKDCVEWAIENATMVLGNHCDMMIDHCRKQGRYERGIWLMNGGDETLNSYGFPFTENVWNKEILSQYIPESHLAWLESLPMFIERDDLFISHAPASMFYNLEFTKTIPPANGSSLVWNRTEPKKMEGKLQLFGHNASWRLRKFGTPPWAICLDTSWDKVLTGYNTKTQEIYQQPYI
jgi:serine/threonine protein phosphatase 1